MLALLYTRRQRRITSRCVCVCVCVCVFARALALVRACAHSYTRTHAHTYTRVPANPPTQYTTGTRLFTGHRPPIGFLTCASYSLFHGHAAANGFVSLSWALDLMRRQRAYDLPSFALVRCRSSGVYRPVVLLRLKK